MPRRVIDTLEYIFVDVIFGAILIGLMAFFEFALYTITCIAFFGSIAFVGMFLIGDPCPWYMIACPFVFFFGLGLINVIDFD